MAVVRTAIGSLSSRTPVTGIGCICPLGGTLAECMDNLYRGRSRFGLPTTFGEESEIRYPVFTIDDNTIDCPSHLQSLGRTAQLAILATAQALSDAGYEHTSLTGKRVGVCIGTTVGSTMNNESLYRQYRRGEKPEMTEMERYYRSNPAEAVAREFGCKGPVATIANACSSGADAIGIGRSWLNGGMCDVVIAGGSDELSHISYLGFISLMIASEKRCTPFDRDRSGLNLGEGAAVLVMEKQAENKKSYCEVLGYATACDAYHVTAPHPQGLGLRLALKQACQGFDCGVDFINAHGTGTAENDRVEMAVIGDLFPGIPYFSVKGVTGHTLGAAGAVEAALTAGCLVHGRLPASHGFHTAPDGAVHLPLSGGSDRAGRCGLSQSLAFGGNNSVLVFYR